MGLQPLSLKRSESKSHPTTNMYSSVEGDGAVAGDRYLEKERELRTDLVGPLSRGLEKMQNSSGGPPSSAKAAAYTPGYDKLGEVASGAGHPPLSSSASASASEDHDEPDSRDELQYDKTGDLAGSGGGGGGSNSGPVGIGRAGSKGGNVGDARRVSREKSFWKRLRVNK